MLRRLVLVAAALILCTGTVTASSEHGESELIAYLRSVQLPDGAFADSNAANEIHVTPYRGAYAAIGLTMAGDASTALAFARWYVAHMNRDDKWGPGCTIYNFTFTREPFVLTSTKTAGAMDAPAGVFLTALRYLYASGNSEARSWVALQQANAECIARAADGLYQPSYECTQAVVGYDFCLTEDNFEVWRGLGDIAWLEGNVWNSSSLEAHYRSEQSKIGEGLEQMWDPEHQDYAWARSIMTGDFTRSSWSQFYPGSVTQLWPVIVGYAQPDDPRSIGLWRAFKAAWPEMPVASPVRSPWPWTAAAAARMGDLQFVAQYDACLGAQYAAKGYPYAWEVNDAGNMLAALVWANKGSRRHWSRESRHSFRYYQCYLQRGARGLSATP